MSSNLAIRVAVAAVAIPIILWISYRGGGWLLGMVLLFAVLAMAEFLINEGFPVSGGFFWFAMAVLVVSFCLSTEHAMQIAIFSEWFPIGGGLIDQLYPLLVFFVVTAVVLAIGREPPAELFKRHSRLVWGVAYVSLLYPFIVKVGCGIGDLHGGDCLLFLFGLLWVGDTAAMGIGTWLGRHKLAPAVSPNKTVEGFVGGIAGAAVIGILMYFWKFQSISFGHVLAVAVGCSVLGQLGDLVESMWKRSLGIKDSSTLVPGHGGVLDRFDSLLFAAPFMYGYLHLIK